MSEQFRNIWHEHLGLVKAVQHQTELNKTDERPNLSVSYQTVGMNR